MTLRTRSWWSQLHALVREIEMKKEYNFRILIIGWSIRAMQASLAQRCVEQSFHCPMSAYYVVAAIGAGGEATEVCTFWGFKKTFLHALSSSHFTAQTATSTLSTVLKSTSCEVSRLVPHMGWFMVADEQERNIRFVSAPEPFGNKGLTNQIWVEFDRVVENVHRLGLVRARMN